MEKNFKQEIMNYLEKTAKHTFIKPTSKWVNKDGKIDVEYDYTDFSYFKVFIDGDKVKLLSKPSSTKSYQITTIDIDYYIKVWSANAKNVLSNSLFEGKKMKSVKQNKYVKSEIAEILESIK